MSAEYFPFNLGSVSFDYLITKNTRTSRIGRKSIGTIGAIHNGRHLGELSIEKEYVYLRCGELTVTRRTTYVKKSNKKKKRK